MRTLLVAAILGATLASMVVAAQGSNPGNQPYTDPFAPTGPPHRLVISGAQAMPSTFAAAGTSATKAGRHSHVGTLLHFHLSAAARVSITVTAATTSRRLGTIVRHAHSGANSLVFSGRLNGRPLKPGRYQGTFHAEAAHANRRARAWSG